MDMYEFNKNRLTFPPEQLLQYRGMYIVWSPDGKRVIASDKDPWKLDDMVIALGYDPSEVVFSSVPDVDIIMGAGVMGEWGYRTCRSRSCGRIPRSAAGSSITGRPRLFE